MHWLSALCRTKPRSKTPCAARLPRRRALSSRALARGPDTFDLIMDVHGCNTNDFCLTDCHMNCWPYYKSINWTCIGPAISSSWFWVKKKSSKSLHIPKVSHYMLLHSLAKERPWEDNLKTSLHAKESAMLFPFHTALNTAWSIFFTLNCLYMTQLMRLPRMKTDYLYWLICW